MKYNNKYLFHTLPLFFVVLLSLCSNSSGQSVQNKVGPTDNVRLLRYRPQGRDFVIINGNKKYNRALYGTHTAFRVEGGDLPEFALFMPGIGGDMKLGIMTHSGSKWLNDFDTIEMRYQPGTILYRLKDNSIGPAEIRLQLLAMDDREGMLLKAQIFNAQKEISLICVYGGASGMHPSRNGDIGADPSSDFSLTPQHSKGNKFTLDKDGFSLFFHDRKGDIRLNAVVPSSAVSKIGDANELSTPKQLWSSNESKETPVFICSNELANERPLFFSVFRKGNSDNVTYQNLPQIFNAATDYIQKIADRVNIETPDPYLNTLGGDLSIAADGIWESPAYMHGAVAWRMWLNGWRGAYVANDLGWHDRAEAEFTAYNKMQLTSPDTAITFPDTAFHLARQKQKLGVGIYNSGYITRLPEGKLVANHYDMNLVYIDEMLRNFQWTGDTIFLRKCWPVIKRNIDWEKRNFDQDDNGLFDAYACIWASDALQYSGGDVAHSSAYNYYANKQAAVIAKLLGYDARPFLSEAAKIKSAMNSILWMPDDGWYAEYKDRLGLQLLHTDAALWTIYHSIDSDVPDAFQSYQMLRYVDTHIPHIPIKCPKLKGDYYMLSTTDWMPYVWSLNNVVMAEMGHTALAYWQGGRNEEAFKLFKSMIVESMFLGSSPGNFEQISYYDKNRGELFRDFADPIGISSRALVEGLYGIKPNALIDTLTIVPGFPMAWKKAAINLPDIQYSFKRNDHVDIYEINTSFKKEMNLKLLVNAPAVNVSGIEVNGKKVIWKNNVDAIGKPQIELLLPAQKKYSIKIKWGDIAQTTAVYDSNAVVGSRFSLDFPHATIVSLNDPQKILSDVNIVGHHLTANINGSCQWHSFFIQIKQGQFCWWMPVNINLKKPFQISGFYNQNKDGMSLRIKNNSSSNSLKGFIVSANDFRKKIDASVTSNHYCDEIFIPAKYLFFGTNKVSVQINNLIIDTIISYWNIQDEEEDLKNKPAHYTYEAVNMTHFFNDMVTNIFKNKYLHPRPTSPTLQLPVQGVGNWCSPLVMPDINDKGLRGNAINNYFKLKNGLSFFTPEKINTSNILFTSQWDNYPKNAIIPLSGKACHAYFLMAGSTNAMQTRMTNGEIIIHYKDNTADTLLLKNPDNWCPIEQDYTFDKYAFPCHAPQPYRLYLQSGKVAKQSDKYINIGGLTTVGVPGGAATILDMPLNNAKILQSLELKTVANDVVIGLMSVTLVRKK